MEIQIYKRDKRRLCSRSHKMRKPIGVEKFTMDIDRGCDIDINLAGIVVCSEEKPRSNYRAKIWARSCNSHTSYFYCCTHLLSLVRWWKLGWTRTDSHPTDSMSSSSTNFSQLEDFTHSDRTRQVTKDKTVLNNPIMTSVIRVIRWVWTDVALDRQLLQRRSVYFVHKCISQVAPQLSPLALPLIGKRSFLMFSLI